MESGHRTIGKRHTSAGELGETVLQFLPPIREISLGVAHVEGELLTVEAGKRERAAGGRFTHLRMLLDRGLVLGFFVLELGFGETVILAALDFGGRRGGGLHINGRPRSTDPELFNPLNNARVRII